MILIGQYDSPFVRRVGIALTLYGRAFEHRPWSAWGDAERLRSVNPLTRVPVLLLDDGEALVDSHSILDFLDREAGAAQALIPETQPDRRRAQRIIALACGAAEKAVSLFYELRLHDSVSPVWVARCRGQIEATLAFLETEALVKATDEAGEGRIGHAGIAVAVALRFIAEALPDQVALDPFPALCAFSRRMEALPVFRTVSQPFIAPR
ncbi:MAG: glutathione S-transferase family protein [Labrys sp. (in: a-proteobacteria)]